MAQIIIPIDPADEFAEDDWEETVELMRPGGPVVFTNTGAEAVLVGEIPVNKQDSFKRRVLGYSIADDAAFKLRRTEVPWNHPIHSTLWADSVAFEEHTPTANPLHLTRLPQKASVEAGPFGKTAYYAGCKVTVRFKPLACALYRDTDAPAWDGTESSRFVTLESLKS